MVDEAALAYMRRHHLAGPVIDRLSSHPQRSFPDRQAWAAHLEALGVAALEVTPDPVKIATQGAMWGTIRRHGLLDGTVVVSDDAGQFRVGTHALSGFMRSGWSTSSCRSPRRNVGPWISCGS